MEIKHTQLLLNGEWVGASDRSTTTLVNPATEETLCEVALATPKDVESAVTSSRAAFDAGPWSKLDGGARAKLMWKLADLVERDAVEIARLETMNQGKPIFESLKIEVPFVASLFRYYAGWADKLEGETIPGVPGFLNYTLREPVGVVGMIIPWNFPLLLTVWKLAPALAGGNTGVLKPSEQTPLTALYLAKIAADIFPKGVLNVVCGRGATVGQPLVEHNGVRMVSITGDQPAVNRAFEIQLVDWFLHRVYDELSGPLTDAIAPIPQK